MKLLFYKIFIATKLVDKIFKIYENNEFFVN